MLTNGRKTVAVAGTPEPVAPPGIRGTVLVQALPGNAGLIALGGPPDLYLAQNLERTTGPKAASGSESGFMLAANETLPVPTEISELWIDAEADGEGVCWFMF